MSQNKFEVGDFVWWVYSMPLDWRVGACSRAWGIVLVPYIDSVPNNKAVNWTKVVLVDVKVKRPFVLDVREQDLSKTVFPKWVCRKLISWCNWAVGFNWRLDNFSYVKIVSKLRAVLNTKRKPLTK